MNFMHFTEIMKCVTFFALKTCSKLDFEWFRRNRSSKSSKYDKENKHFAMVRILMFLSRTCIGDNGFFGLFNGICEPLVSGSKPAYFYKQRR